MLREESHTMLVKRAKIKEKKKIKEPVQQIEQEQSYKHST